jgi:16S rRNA processing protein RimM
MENIPERVEVGIVINTFGVKGEVKVMPLTDGPEQFAEFKKVFLAKPGVTAAEYEIRKVRAHKKWVILRLKGIETRDQAFKLRDYNIYVEKGALRELPADTYLQSDLHGMEVFDTKDELLGVITDVLKTPANDIYQIRAEGGEEYLIPAIKDVVKEVNIEANRMVIDPIRGLI